jgi:alkylation response protein AidB-like acyl-CoA dehydrogenase
MRYSMNLMNGARLAVAAQALGIAEAAWREADRYSKERIQFGKPIRVLPAVGRLLLSMRVDLEATRALLAETATWVDLWKVYEKAVGDVVRRRSGDPARLKACAAVAETMTPMVKYCSTEMGNRVCYQSMQVHGGVGYMKEFNIERLFRDVRITNIYEGTSQLQVVAAIGKLLNRSLDPLFAEWEAAEYPADMAAREGDARRADRRLPGGGRRPQSPARSPRSTTTPAIWSTRRSGSRAPGFCFATRTS